MLKLIKEQFQNIDSSIKVLMKKGSYFCLFILWISSVLLATYELFYNSPDLYYIGLSVFKLGIIFYVTFLCCGFAFNKIKEDFF